MTEYGIKAIKTKVKHGDVLSTEEKNFICKVLEKQIPLEPCCISEMDENDNAMVECPICHANSDYAINTIKIGHCWKCGQIMKW